MSIIPEITDKNTGLMHINNELIKENIELKSENQKILAEQAELEELYRSLIGDFQKLKEFAKETNTDALLEQAQSSSFEEIISTQAQQFVKKIFDAPSKKR